MFVGICILDDIMTWKNFLLTKSQWCGPLMICLLWAWTSCWTNSRDSSVVFISLLFILSFRCLCLPADYIWSVIIRKMIFCTHIMIGWIFSEFNIMTSSNEIHRSPVNSPHKGQWHGALMFSLICAWMNGWVNNREADDLRRHHAYFDATVMRVQNCNRILMKLHSRTLKMMPCNRKLY